MHVSPQVVLNVEGEVMLERQFKARYGAEQFATHLIPLQTDAPKRDFQDLKLPPQFPPRDVAEILGDILLEVVNDPTVRAEMLSLKALPPARGVLAQQVRFFFL